MRGLWVYRGTADIVRLVMIYDLTVSPGGVRFWGEFVVLVGMSWHDLSGVRLPSELLVEDG